PPTRVISGTVLTEKNEAVLNVIVIAEFSSGKVETKTDPSGNFRLTVPNRAVQLRVSGKYIVSQPLALDASSPSDNIQLRINYSISSVHESLVITATALNPAIDERNDTVYKSTLFSRDDQLFDTLAAGINTGQHEGGGKSLEIRRFGFNLDHGGVNGGLK